MPTFRRLSVRLRPPPRRMSSVDAAFLYLERAHAPLHIGCLARVEGALAAPDLARRVSARLARMRRYGERVAPVPLALGHPTWEGDPAFDPADHVRRWSLPPPGGAGELAELVEELWARPLDRARPLWEMHVVEGLAGGGTAVLQKVHHCMVDGVAGAQLLETLLDESPVARERYAWDALPPPLPGAGERMRRALADGVREGLRRQAAGARALAEAVASPLAARRASERLRDAAWQAVRLAAGEAPVLPWNERVGRRRRLAFTDLPLDGVRRIRARHGGTVNDVVLAVLAGGLHRYLRSQGVETRGLEPVALVPVSRRGSGDGATGNRISAMLVPLAVDPEGEVARLASTRALTASLKSRAAWAGIDDLLRALDGLPAPLVALAGGRASLGRMANLVATNVPGPRGPRWLCGRRVTSLQPLVPITDGIGLGLAVFSYDGALHVGLNADPALVPDLDKLREGIEAAFAALAGGA